LDQITIETPTTDTGVDTLRALSSSSVQPSPTFHNFTIDQLRYIESHVDVRVQTDILSDGRSIETALEIMTQNINNLQLRIDYLTSTISQNVNNMSNLQSIIPKISAAQAFSDHPSYLIYMAQNPMTNTILDIVANPYIFNSMNIF